jgi:hypothetical protein
MNADYVYCTSCGYEDFDIFVAYIRSTANADCYECPSCKQETTHVEAED